MSGYVASGNMYGNARVFSSPFSNIHTEPFKTSVNELYNYMLRRCLRRTKEYDNANTPLDFAMLRLLQEEIEETNPLSVVLDNDSYYFTDSKGIRRIDKYESN